MSEAAAPAPAATPAPAADASASQGAGTTPTKPIANPPAVGAPAPSTAERLAEVLKGGFEVTANGQKHKIESVEQLTRYLQRGIPADSVLKQAAEEKAKLAPFAEALRALKEGDDATAEQLLEQMLGPQRLRSVAEARLRREFAREKQMQEMSPRERELFERAQKLESEKSAWEKSQKQLTEQQAQVAHQQQVEKFQQHIGTSVEGALKLLGIDTKDQVLVPTAIRHMRSTIQSMLTHGIPLDPQVLADAVRPEFEATLQFMTKNLDGEALLKVLGQDVGKKVRNALLAQIKSGGVAPARAAAVTTVTPTTEGDRPTKLDFRKPIF